MQPYPNPYLFQQPNYQQMFQPSFQPSFPANLPTQISGRMIESIDNITANDVPMTGLSVFPKNDMSEIYIKSWQNDGTIRTLKYVPYSPVKAVENGGVDTLSPVTLDATKQGDLTANLALSERLDNIEELLNKILNKKVTKNESKSDS